MKALFITTETNETPKYPESFASVNGNEVKHVIFHHRGVPGALGGSALDNMLLDEAKAYKPEIIIYLGACGGNIPSIPTFCKLNNNFAPTVLMCSDAADVVSPWTYLLSQYDKAKAFSCVVAIDGNRNWEFSDRHLTLLTPIDPRRYPSPPIPHKNRGIPFGFAGNVGSFKAMKNGKPAGRRMLIAQMQTFGLQTRQRDDSFDASKPHSESYQECVNFMANTRVMPNFCETGSYERTHVKGRVVEAGLAGTMLLEQVGSPADQWFEKGVDYIEYRDTRQVKSFIKSLIANPDETEGFGMRLRAKVMAEHTPEKFWGKVIGRVRDIRSIA